MNGEYLTLQVKQEKNVIIIKVVNIPEYVDVNERLISIPSGDADGGDNYFFLRASSLYNYPEICMNGSDYGLILPVPEDDVNEMNYAGYQFDSEEEANTYRCNLSKAIKLYNEHIRYKEANNGYITTNEWMVIQ